MKKILLLTTLVVVLLLSACGDNNDASDIIQNEVKNTTNDSAQERNQSPATNSDLSVDNILKQMPVKFELRADEYGTIAVSENGFAAFNFYDHKDLPPGVSLTTSLKIKENEKAGKENREIAMRFLANALPDYFSESMDFLLAFLEKGYALDQSTKDSKFFGDKLLEVKMDEQGFVTLIITRY